MCLIYFKDMKDRCIFKENITHDHLRRVARDAREGAQPSKEKASRVGSSSLNRILHDDLVRRVFR